MSEQYQDFGDGGASDSMKKLEELNLPEDMTGMRVLDMGCNAGFFCIEAAKRGATCVGIEARENYHRDASNNAMKAGVSEQCEFHKGMWGDVLPELKGKFDYILWLAAMHYEPRPKAILVRLRNLMNYKARIVLDIGLHDNRNDPSDWGKLPRPGQMDSYPSRDMLDKVFSEFVLRRMGPSNSLGHQGCRLIFHATLREPTVLLVGGIGGQGKTSLTDVIGKEAIKITTDSLLSIMDTEPQDDSSFGREITAFKKEIGSLLGNQWKLMSYLSDPKREKFLKHLADMLCHHVNYDFPYYVIEGGLMTFPEFHKYVKESIGKGFRVWSCSLVP